MEETRELTIFEHLEELRNRLFVILGTVLFFSLIAFSLAGFFRRLILMPAGDIFLIYLAPPEAFLVSMKLAFTVGFIAALPVAIYQVLAFILPGLYKEERRILFPSFLVIGILFYSGLGFSYFVAFPFALRFFLGFATEKLQPMFTFSQYLAFFTRFHLAFSLVFQVPLFFALLGGIGVVSKDFLKKSKRYAVLVIVIVSALITPPDIFSQVLMVLPLYILFELGIFLVGIIEKRRKKRNVEEE